jgi:glycosyltransferase involved in cell wall biosynthesis
MVRFQPTPKTLPDLTVLLASRLLWSKGITEFVAAAVALRARYPGLRFAIAGDMDPGNPGSLEQRDLDLLAAHPNIALMGHVADMAALLGVTDLVVLPTSYGEGVPRILVEAAACGLPLIATDAPGCREIVRSGVNGFLVDAHDVLSLVTVIERLADDPALRARMGAESRRIAVAEFGEEMVLGATIGAYHLRPRVLALAPTAA